MTDNTYNKPDGLTALEELNKILLSELSNNNSQLSIRILSEILRKVNIVIQIIGFKPRLPLFQIEETVKEICRADPSTQGVIIEMLFTKKYETLDRSKLSLLTIKV